MTIVTQAALDSYQTNGWRKTASIRKGDYREITLTRNPSTKSSTLTTVGKTAAYLVCAPIIFSGSILACVCDWPFFCDPDRTWSETSCGPNIDFYYYCFPSPEATEIMVRVPVTENTSLLA